MTSALLGLGALILVSVLVFARLRRRSRPRAQVAATAQALREGVLSRKMLTSLAPAPGAIRGVVMDWKLGNGLATLVAIDDGTVSLYLNPGGGVLGAGAKAKVAGAATKFRDEGNRQRAAFVETKTFPAPGPGTVVYYLLTDAETLTSGPITVADIQQRTHPLAILGALSQALLTEVRLASEAHK